MKIHLIGMYENPTADGIFTMKSVAFAHFSAVGTWVYEREPCNKCGWHWQTRVAPLLVQWQPSTQVIGDFSWDGPFGYVCVVQEPIAAKLNAMGFECSFTPVDFVRPDRKRHAVPFPYEGPPLLWMKACARIELDMAASSVEQTSSCSECGDVRHTFLNHDITIRRSKWSNQKIFRITTNGRSQAIFITDEGRELIQKAGLSNISFSEAGQIVEG